MKKSLLNRIDQTLVIYEGVTTSDGDAGGTYLICAALIGKPNVFAGKTLLIAAGSDTGDLVGIIDFNTLTGRLSVNPPFQTQIKKGFSFLVINFALQPLLHIINEHFHSVGFVRPSGTPGALLTSNAAPWTLGAFSADIITAADPITSLHTYDIHWYEISGEDSNADYEVVLYGTYRGVDDTEVDRIKFSRSNATNRSSEQAAHMPRLDAGSRLRAKMMDSGGGATCRISVHGHSYE
jgi:hypothetical protein